MIARSSLALSGRDRRRDEARRLRDLLALVLEHSPDQAPRLPDEMTLSRQYGVSRNSVRDALAILVEEQRVSRQVGSGSFVRGVPGRSAFDRIVDVSTIDDPEPGGDVVSGNGFRILDPVPPGIAQALDLGWAGPLAVFERVVARAGTPIELRTYFLPLRTGEVITEQDVDADVYQLIEARLGRSIRTAVRAVSATAADAGSADALGIAPGSPVLFMESRLQGPDGGVVLVTFGRHRSDRMTVTFTATRPVGDVG